jgi:hypothetical protein
MLVDPKTFQITAVLDLEFTNSMPSQFASDPPWWLLLVGPETWLQEGRSMVDFIAAYEPQMRRFIKAMERAEGRSIKAGTPYAQRPLSRLMVESWDTKRFWFDYAIRKPLDVDGIFYRHLNDGTGPESMDEVDFAEMEPFVEMKMRQLEEYKKDRADHFRSKEQGGFVIK